MMSHFSIPLIRQPEIGGSAPDIFTSARMPFPLHYTSLDIVHTEKLSPVRLNEAWMDLKPRFSSTPLEASVY